MIALAPGCGFFAYVGFSFWSARLLQEDLVHVASFADRQVLRPKASRFSAGRGEIERHEVGTAPSPGAP